VVSIAKNPLCVLGSYLQRSLVQCALSVIPSDTLRCPLMVSATMRPDSMC